MKPKFLIASFAIHLILTALMFIVSFETEEETITLNYGDVKFSTHAKKEIESGSLKNFSDEKENNLSEKGENGIPDKNEGSEIQGKENFVKNYANGKFSIDFLGKRSRMIYSYSLPEYPPGVEKEIDIVMKITIEPDGTISGILPLIKADSRLEIAAINALKNWRFEPLPEKTTQTKQEAIVVFPYRLK